MCAISSSSACQVLLARKVRVQAEVSRDNARATDAAVARLHRFPDTDSLFTTTVLSFQSVLG
jgi:hypothetical protein